MLVSLNLEVTVDSAGEVVDVRVVKQERRPRGRPRKVDPDLEAMGVLLAYVERAGGVPQAARMLGVSRSAVDQWKHRGRVPEEYLAIMRGEDEDLLVNRINDDEAMLALRGYCSDHGIVTAAKAAGVGVCVVVGWLRDGRIPSWHRAKLRKLGDIVEPLDLTEGGADELVELRWLRALVRAHGTPAAAMRVGVTYAVLYQWLKRGVIPASRVPLVRAAWDKERGL